MGRPCPADKRGRAVCVIVVIGLVSIFQLLTSLVVMDDGIIPTTTKGVSVTTISTQTVSPSIINCNGSECVTTTTQPLSTTELSIGNSSSFEGNKHDNGQCFWLNFTVKGPPYFLTAVFYIRIYEEDKSELKTSDIKHWLEYLRFAGVEHVYVYDNWLHPSEQQREALDVFIQQGYLTYTDWHDHRKPNIWHISAYQHCIDNYGGNTTWQIAIDIDEYPFSPTDTNPGFLSRFISNFTEAHRYLSQVTMQNYLYLGEKDKSKQRLIEQLWRRTHGPANKLVKPIYKPRDIGYAQLHHNKLWRGLSMNAPTHRLRMNHYWGARLQNWGPNTEDILRKTEEDHAMEPIIALMKKCENHNYVL